MYIKRAIEKPFMTVASEYPVVFLDGPRQTGKTTLLKKLAENDSRTYVSLDDLEVRRIATETPQVFFQLYKPPVLIDEIQYAPDLFPYIKLLADRDRRNGAFWLTSSQQFRFLKGITESLAGRIAIVSLYSLSLNEISGGDDDGTQFLPSLNLLAERARRRKKIGYMELFDLMIRGGMPVLNTDPAMDRDRFFKNYINSYISRDAVDYYGINNPSQFYRFLIACSARTAQLVNYSSIASDVGVSVPTAKAWLQILEAMGIVFLLRSYEKTKIKSVTKVPKLYFMDTGFASYLAGWMSGTTLERSVHSGFLFENFVVSEIKKNITNLDDSATELYFFRDKNQREIDLLIEKNRTIYPIEIKKSLNVDSSMVKSFSVLKGMLDYEIGEGGIIYPGDHIIPIGENIYSIPVYLI